MSSCHYGYAPLAGDTTSARFIARASEPDPVSLQKLHKALARSRNRQILAALRPSVKTCDCENAACAPKSLSGKDRRVGYLAEALPKTRAGARPMFLANGPPDFGFCRVMPPLVNGQ
jgi:hypothetical protein